MTTIQEIHINYLAEPVGITGKIQVGWVFDSDAENVHQISYEIETALSPAFENPVTAGGAVQSEDSSHAEVCADWEDFRRYYLRVRARVQTSEGEELTGWAQTSFVTGFQNIEDWEGKFVTAEKPEDADQSFGTYLRREFSVKKPLKAAWLASTAHGLYHVYINGKKAGKDQFAPGWTSYDKRLLYQTCEITDLLQEGENAVGVHVGPGWYKGTMTFNRVHNLYGDRTAFGGQIILDYEDGSREVIASDSSWKGSRSPVLFSEIYDGETYDARLEQDGWSEPGFDDSSWIAAEEVKRDVLTLFPQEGCTVQEITKVEPVSLFQTPQGDTVIDFGQNLTGWAHVTVENAAPGSRAVLNYFEVLDAQGNVYRDNLRTAKETVIYYCRGGEKEEYHPLFSYQGFRYVKIAEFPGEAKKENFTAWAVHSNMEPTGEFSCSNPLINQLQHNILWGMKGNFLDIPTDCPQRDERLGWTGDAQIFCRTASFLMNTDAFYRKWAADVAADQTEEGAVAHVVPDKLTGYSENDQFMSTGTFGASGWGDVAVILPWNIYLTFGDCQILEQQYDSMKNWIGFMQKHSTEGCLFSYGLQFGDWVALDAQEGSYFGATPTIYTSAAYYCYVTGLFAKIAGVLGRKQDEEAYGTLYRELRDSFIDHFYDEDGQLTVQTQTAQILALEFDLVPESSRQIVVENLKELLADEDGHLVTGFLGTPYFTHALSENGALDEAYELLLKEDFPSWLYQVKMGATTVWEHWDGLKPDGTMWSPDMNSFNHYAYGSVGEWLYRTVGGLEIDEQQPGYRHFYVQPLLGGGLRWADLAYESVCGRIEIHWEVQGEKKILSVTVPPNTTATIRLRQAKRIVDAGGLKPEKASEGWQLEAGSGKRQICFV